LRSWTGRLVVDILIYCWYSVYTVIRSAFNRNTGYVFDRKYHNDTTSYTGGVCI